MLPSLPGLLICSIPATQIFAVANYQDANVISDPQPSVGTIYSSQWQSPSGWLDQTRYQEAKEILSSYVNLAEGWDGESGRPASRHAVRKAIDFLNRLDRNMYEPSPMIAANGEISFYWDYADRYAEIGFDDGQISYFFLRQNGRETIYADDEPIDSILIHDALAFAFVSEVTLAA